MPSQFGQLLEAIVGSITGTIMGVSAAADALTAKRYVNSIQRTQNAQDQAAITNEQQQIASDQQSVSSQSQLSTLQTQSIQKVTVIALAMLLLVVVIGLAAFYYAAVGRENA